MSSLLEYFLYTYPNLQLIRRDFLVAGSALVSGLILLVFAVGAGVMISWLNRKSMMLIRRPGTAPQFQKKGSSKQSFAAWIKLFFKKQELPAGANSLFFLIPPILSFAVSFVSLSVLPLSDRFYLFNSKSGILIILTLLSVYFFITVIANLESEDFRSLYESFQTSMQFISLLAPLWLSTVPVLLWTGSLNPMEIVSQQEGGIMNWLLVRCFPFTFLSFAVYCVAAMMAVFLHPFGITAHHTEFPDGALKRYAGVNGGFIHLARNVNMLVLASIGSILFLGGWEAPAQMLDFIPGIFWMLVKILLLLIAGFWIHWTSPTLSRRFMIRLSWKTLMILSFLSIIGVGICAG